MQKLFSRNVVTLLIIIMLIGQRGAFIFKLLDCLVGCCIGRNYQEIDENEIEIQPGDYVGHLTLMRNQINQILVPSVEEIPVNQLKTRFECKIKSYSEFILQHSQYLNSIHVYEYDEVPKDTPQLQEFLESIDRLFAQLRDITFEILKQNQQVQQFIQTNGTDMIDANGFIDSLIENIKKYKEDWKLINYKNPFLLFDNLIATIPNNLMILQEQVTQLIDLKIVLKKEDDLNFDPQQYKVKIKRVVFTGGDPHNKGQVPLLINIQITQLNDTVELPNLRLAFKFRSMKNEKQFFNFNKEQNIDEDQEGGMIQIKKHLFKLMGFQEDIVQHFIDFDNRPIWYNENASLDKVFGTGLAIEENSWKEKIFDATDRTKNFNLFMQKALQEYESEEDHILGSLKIAQYLLYCHASIVTGLNSDMHEDNYMVFRDPRYNLMFTYVDLEIFVSTSSTLQWLNLLQYSQCNQTVLNFIQQSGLHNPEQIKEQLLKSHLSFFPNKIKKRIDQNLKQKYPFYFNVLHPFGIEYQDYIQNFPNRLLHIDSGVLLNARSFIYDNQSKINDQFTLSDQVLTKQSFNTMYNIIDQGFMNKSKLVIQFAFCPIQKHELLNEFDGNSMEFCLNKLDPQDPQANQKQEQNEKLILLQREILNQLKGNFQAGDVPYFYIHKNQVKLGKEYVIGNLIDIQVEHNQDEDEKEEEKLWFIKFPHEKIEDQDSDEIAIELRV